MKNHKIKVMFIHGLESGPYGSKSNYFRNYFTANNYYAVKLACSPKKFEKNSITCALFKLPIIYLLIILFSVMLYHQSYKLLFCWLFAVLTSYKKIFNAALNQSVDDCLCVVDKAIQEFEPTIIVASSFGGLVAAEAIRRGVITKPTLMLAPALKHIHQRYYHDSRILKSHIPILVIHGVKDEVCSIEYSKKFVNEDTEHRSLITIDDEHRCLTLFKEKHKYSYTIEKLIEELNENKLPEF